MSAPAAGEPALALEEKDFSVSEQGRSYGPADIIGKTADAELQTEAAEERIVERAAEARPMLAELAKDPEVRSRVKSAVQGLSTGQREAFFDLIGPLVMGEAGTKRKLTGYAGTGKTFLAGRICHVLDDFGIDVVCAAPTHKAATQLAITLGEDLSVEAHTLHSLLGLKLMSDGKGGRTLKQDDDPSLPDEGGVVLVDEASMVGKDLWGHVEDVGGKCKWLFQGDMGQLPPVAEGRSEALKIEGPNLERVIRQSENNPIVEFSMAVRNREGDYRKKARHTESGNGVFVTRSEERFVEVAEMFFQKDRFSREPDYARILAYTNEKVGEYNRKIRARVYGEGAPAYVEGEWLVADGTWFSYGIPRVLNSETLQVRRAKKETDRGSLKGPWKIWELKVKPADRSAQTIKVLDPEEEGRYASVRSEVKESALGAGAERMRKAQWNTYYKMERQYASVSPAYASTIHKAQGSTFDTVLVDHRDLMSVRKKMRYKLIYVAVTRPQRRVGILF